LTVDWGDYSLLDCGDGAKLESFGEIVLQRPSPQSLWPRLLPAARWNEAAAHYTRSSEGGGDWTERVPLPQEWWIESAGLRLRIQATGFGHLGLFPEQLPLWEFIRTQCAGARPNLRILNLFAYTGGASIAAAQKGAHVTHCDGSRGIVQWASTNAQANGFGGEDNPLQDAGNIRWIVDDAERFVAREVKRNRVYDAVILDPPSFGRGPKGQVWKLERDLLKHLTQLAGLLSESAVFVLLSAHTPGVDPLGLQILLESGFLRAGRKEQASAGRFACGCMSIPQSGGMRRLPSGNWAAWTRDGGMPEALTLREFS